METLLADENVPAQTVRALLEAGFRVDRVQDVMPGANDSDVIGVALARSAVLVTADTDFGELLIRGRHPVAGLVLTELDRLAPTEAAAVCAAALVRHRSRLSGNLLVVEPGRVRVRPLVTPGS